MMPNKGKQTLPEVNGKLEEQAKSSLSKPNPVMLNESLEAVAIRENTVTFPLLKTLFKGRLMPRYTSIINRTKEEGVRVEDLDILKIELKGLLANVTGRVLVLLGELKNHASMADEKKEEKQQNVDEAKMMPNNGNQTLPVVNGKPEEQAKSSLSKPNPVMLNEPLEAVAIIENTLTFPLLKTLDKCRLMPRYTSIINRTKEEGVGVEDLDILKIELKGLLANVTGRVLVLLGELKNHASMADEKKEEKQQNVDEAKMMPNNGKQTLPVVNGKPEEQAKSSLSKPNPVMLNESLETVAIIENTLTFPLLKTLDKGRLMPRYTSIINRTKEEGVRFEDLDILKIELKGLLANVSGRLQVLKGEQKNLANVPDEKKEKKRQMMDKAPASPAKRGKYDDKLIKKQNEACIKGCELVSCHSFIKMTGVKNITAKGPAPPSAALPPEPEPPQIISPRNDNSSKLWQSLEQYCGDITPMDIKFLEESIRCRERRLEIAPIPRLGEHCASHRAKEDLRVEQEASSSSGGERRGTSTLAIEGRLEALTRGSDADVPFTLRLVAALRKENVLSPEDIIAEPVCKDGENITPSKSNKIVNSGSVSYSNNVKVEETVIKELEEQQGPLEKDVQPKAPTNDEIMREINRVQSELADITAYNFNRLNEVLHKARHEMRQQGLKKMLKIVDDEVRVVYKKFAAYKLEKRLPSEKEKEQAWRLLKEQKYLLHHLYGRDSQGMHTRVA